jgi:hypothetical protein
MLPHPCSIFCCFVVGFIILMAGAFLTNLTQDLSRTNSTEGNFTRVTQCQGKYFTCNVIYTYTNSVNATETYTFGHQSKTQMRSMTLHMNIIINDRTYIARLKQFSRCSAKYLSCSTSYVYEVNNVTYSRTVFFDSYGLRHFTYNRVIEYNSDSPGDSPPYIRTKVHESIITMSVGGGIAGMAIIIFIVLIWYSRRDSNHNPTTSSFV